MFKPNIGTLNALIRITLGFTVMSVATAKLTRKPWSLSAKLWIFLGALKIASGIVRFCPTMTIFKLCKYMNLPRMNFMKKGESNKQEAHDAPSHHEKATYDASDKEMEQEMMTAILGTNSK